MSVAKTGPMVTLEARFSPPDQPTGNYIVVGYVTWSDRGGPPTIEPSASLGLAPAPATILATLRHLVNAAARTPAHLESLRARHWSFVHVEDALVA